MTRPAAGSEENVSGCCIVCETRAGRPSAWAQSGSPAQQDFSTKINCHLAAVSPHGAFYNLCRTHKALQMTPAIALYLTDRMWAVTDLIKAG